MVVQGSKQVLRSLAIFGGGTIQANVGPRKMYLHDNTHITSVETTTGTNSRQVRLKEVESLGKSLWIEQPLENTVLEGRSDVTGDEQEKNR